MTIVELSSKANSSPASVVRFCQLLGYKGYKEFSKDLNVSLVAAKRDVQVPEQEATTVFGDTMRDTIIAVTKANVSAIENSISIVDAKALEQMANIIDKARKLYIFAIGGSTVASHDAVFKFTRLGIECQAFDNLHDQRLAASLLHENDAALFISYSGETKDLLKTLAVAKKTKAYCMSMTKFGDNAISRAVALSVHHASVYEGAKNNSTRSRIVQLNLIDILFIYLSKRRNAQFEEFYRLTDGGRLSERNK